MQIVFLCICLVFGSFKIAMMQFYHLLFLFNIDVDELLNRYGLWVYAIMFLIIFCETGLVVTPVLPGDSMIFAAATLSAREGNILNVHLIALLMTIAAFSGDVTNYFIGRFIGPKVYRKNYKLINQERLRRARDYFWKYGARIIVYARFIPIIRTFAPFVAGVSEMNYKRFMLFNFLGGISWVALYAYCGYFLGNLPFVKKNFEITVLTCLFITLIPAIYAIVKSKFWMGSKERQG